MPSSIVFITAKMVFFKASSSSRKYPQIEYRKHIIAKIFQGFARDPIGWWQVLVGVLQRPPRNTTIKNKKYVIKLCILATIFSFFYDILHCATQQNNFCPLYNVGKCHTAVRNSNYRPLVLFCLCDSILYNSFLNQKIVKFALK